jgi:hypothetical protein
MPKKKKTSTTDEPPTKKAKKAPVVKQKKKNKKKAKAVVTEAERREQQRADAEEHYRKMGAAFLSTAMQIVVMCFDGQSVRSQQRAYDADTSRHARLHETLDRLQERARKLQTRRQPCIHASRCCSWLPSSAPSVAAGGSR